MMGPLGRHDPVTELTSEQEGIIAAIRQKVKELDDLIGKVPNNRGKSLALTNLDQARMWAIQAVTHGEATNLVAR